MLSFMLPNSEFLWQYLLRLRIISTLEGSIEIRLSERERIELIGKMLLNSRNLHKLCNYYQLSDVLVHFITFLILENCRNGHDSYR